MLAQWRQLLLSQLHTPARRAAAGAALAVLVLFVALRVLLAWGKDLDERHRPLAFAESFDFATGTLADYSAWSERRLRAARPDLTPDVSATLGPFRLEPPKDCPASTSATYRNGILLTHDVLDTPYGMRELGEYFQERCFLVYGLLLPGHGTRPGDLLTTGWEDWVAAETFAARELAGEVENLYLGGPGVGGTLAILEASGNAGVDGLVLFAPALDMRAASWRATAGTLFGWLVGGARWADVIPAYTIYRYESVPYGASGDTSALVEATIAALPNRPFEVPVFTVASMEDASVSTPAILAFMAERTHPLSHTVLYSRKLLPAQPGQTVINTYYPDERKLLSLSHQGLMLPMHDPEFGWNGASRDCGHYFRPDQDAWRRCRQGEGVLQGEITPEQLAEGLVERTESNPFYYEMARELDTFIAPVARIRVIRQR